MTATDEKSSNYESHEAKGLSLDARRRAALAEVDNAKFSFVSSSLTRLTS